MKSKEQGCKSNKNNGLAPTPATASNISSATSSRRPIVPNIAAAGRLLAPKWAEVKPTASNLVIKQENASPTRQSNKNNHQRMSNGVVNRANDGRKRGRGRGRKDVGPSIIASEGVFSQGIGADSSEKRIRGVRLKGGEETVIGKLETSLHDGYDDADFVVDSPKKRASDKHERATEADKKHPKLEDRGPLNAYEEFWHSDEDADKEELDEIVRENNFIADLKKCDQVPFVLPSNEEPQFHRIIQENNNKDNFNCEDKREADIKDVKLGELSPNKNLHSSTCNSQSNKFLAAGSIIRNMALERNEDSPLMLFQLPSGFLRIVQEENQQHRLAGGHQQSNAPERQHQSSSLASGQEGGHPQSPTTGLRVGKLQMLRNGRTVLRVGGHRMDISEAIPSNCTETLLRIETVQQQNVASADSSSYPQPSTSQLIRSNSVHPSGAGQHIGSPFIGHSYSANRLADLPFSGSHLEHQGNIAHLLGPLPYQFVCSFDLNRLLDRNRDDQKRPADEVMEALGKESAQME